MEVRKMKVKMFQASGFDEINALELGINHWIQGNVTDNLEVKDTSSSLCQIGEADRGERYQHLVVCIWYGPR